MATWNSSTALNATVSGSIAASGEISITLTPSGTMTAGDITIEENDGGGWSTLATHACSGLSTTTLTRNARNCTIRARLDTVIAGTGSVDVEVVVTPPPNLITSANFSSNFQDSVTPTGAVNGTNTAFVLPTAPNPAASLVLVFRPTTGTPVVLIQGVDYTLSGVNITMGTAPNNGVLYAWSRI